VCRPVSLAPTKACHAMQQDADQIIERLRSDPAQQQQWLRQNDLKYGGLITSRRPAAVVRWAAAFVRTPEGERTTNRCPLKLRPNVAGRRGIVRIRATQATLPRSWGCVTHGSGSAPGACVRKWTAEPP